MNVRVCACVYLNNIVNQVKPDRRGHAYEDETGHTVKFPYWLATRTPPRVGGCCGPTTCLYNAYTKMRTRTQRGVPGSVFFFLRLFFFFLISSRRKREKNNVRGSHEKCTSERTNVARRHVQSATLYSAWAGEEERDRTPNETNKKPSAEITAVRDTNFGRFYVQFIPDDGPIIGAGKTVYTAMPGTSRCQRVRRFTLIERTPFVVDPIIVRG